MAPKNKQGQNQEHPAPLSLPDNNNLKKNCKDISRRIFVKKAVIAGIAVTSAAGLTKAVSSVVSQNSLGKNSSQDDIQQDKIMFNKKYVLMSEEEKKQTVQILIRSYKEQA